MKDIATLTVIISISIFLLFGDFDINFTLRNKGGYRVEYCGLFFIIINWSIMLLEIILFGRVMGSVDKVKWIKVTRINEQTKN